MTLCVAAECEDVPLVGDEPAMLGSTGHRGDDDFKAQAFGQVQGSSSQGLVDSVPKLTTVVVTPREKLRIAPVNLAKIRAGSVLLTFLLDGARSRL